MSLDTTMFDSGLLSPVRVGSMVEAMVSDNAWVEAMAEAEAALARAQARLGIIPASAADAITQASRDQRIDPRDIAVASRETANPVVALIREFTEVVRVVDPTAVDYVHRGSTSQDIFDTAAMLITKRAMERIAVDLDAIARSLARHVSVHEHTMQAGRTLALHAVPITFGLKAAGWLQLVHDARVRVERLIAEGLPVSLGGAAGTLAGYIEYARADYIELADRSDAFARELTQAYAAETGLSTTTLPWHALRTPIADIAATTAFVTGALGKIAVDVLTLSRTEIAELAEPGRPGRGASSAMPHKRNPVLATMIRSAAIQLPGIASGLNACVLAADERDAGTWHAEWLLLRESLRLTGGAAHTAVELVEGLTVNREAMRANLERTGEEMALERVSIALTPTVGKAQAKDILSQLVDLARARRQSLLMVAQSDEWLVETLGKDRLLGLLDPASYTGIAQSVVLLTGLEAVRQP